MYTPSTHVRLQKDNSSEGAELHGAYPICMIEESAISGRVYAGIFRLRTWSQKHFNVKEKNQSQKGTQAVDKILVGIGKLEVSLDRHNIKRKIIIEDNMRTLFLTLIFAFMTMQTFAQTSEHLSFKGVPIDGTLNEYVSKMKQNGFTYIKTEDGTAILNGDFAGYKDCTVGVATLKQKDLVHKIVVIFSDKDTWSRLSTNYFDLKAMLTEKYGKPSDVLEKFDGNSQPRDDNSKM